MRRILSGAPVLALMVATPALAADLPVKGPAMIPGAPAQLSWTGCFIGGHIGGAFRRITLPTASEFRALTFRPVSSAADRSAATINSVPAG
jgi:hypothetical protein